MDRVGSTQSLLVYTDEHLVVANKPSGMLVHRGWDNDRVVLLTEVRRLIGERVYPIHRLDRGASGVVVFARSPHAARAACDAFAERKVHKTYLALVRGAPPSSGTIDHAIPRAPGGDRVPAVTDFRSLATAGRYSLVEVVPRTGRLHQIRRHLKHISCPIIGDVKYGKGDHNRYFRETFGLHRLFLHASELAMAHPVTGVMNAFRAPLPADLTSALAGLGLARP